MNQSAYLETSVEHLPTTKQLHNLFERLEDLGFAESARVPVFAARCWSPALEFEAWRRFRASLPNLTEVAVPSWYNKGLGAEQRQLFEGLSLGLCPPPESLLGLTARCLGNPQRWLVLARFGKYFLASHPAWTQDPWYVYFGDDTLLLMAVGRETTQELQQANEGPLAVLDLCCGGGGVGLALAPFAGSLLGLDFNPVAVSLAERLSKVYGLRSTFTYRVADVFFEDFDSYDLIIGNPPTLPPELSREELLFAVGGRERFLSLLAKLECALKASGRMVLTLFSVAPKRKSSEGDLTYLGLVKMLEGRRGFRYTVRRQFRLGNGGCLRHVLLEIFPLSEAPEESFCLGSPGHFELPFLNWRRPRQP